MDRFVNSKFEQQTIYQIYRACRLCGAGAGYKMPIIQNVVHLDGRDVELRQKIRECVQIEVTNDDKMPPLICELCWDKVNDFYEFLDMCRQTDKRTRHRLGLPLQTLARGAPDSGDCILGLTEPVYVHDDSDEPSTRSKPKSQKGKARKEPEVKVKTEIKIEDSKRSSRSSPPVRRKTRASLPSPPPSRRERRYSDLSQQQGKKNVTQLKSILKKEKDIKVEVDLMFPRSKRPREKEIKKEVPTKRVKIAPKPVAKPVTKPATKPATKSITKPGAKPTNASNQVVRGHQTTSRTKTPTFPCDVCGREFQSIQSLSNHQRVHKSNTNNATKQVKINHLPPKETRTPNKERGAKCSKCERVYLTRKNYLRHVSSCSFKEKVLQAVVEPSVLRSLRQVQIRVARCDALLASQGSCHVTGLSQDYGLDRRCVYPYISSVRSLRIKTEPADTCDGMVDIGEEIKRELEEGHYVHWDSDASSDCEDQDQDQDQDRACHGPDSGCRRRPKSLLRLALQIIYSERLLGKVPRKRRKIKTEIREETSALEPFNDDDDDLERFGENISDKVTSFDDILRGGDEDMAGIENRVEKSRVEDGVWSTENSVQPLGDDSEVMDQSSSGIKTGDKSGDGTSDLSQQLFSNDLVLGVNSDKCVETKTVEVSEDNSESLDSNVMVSVSKEGSDKLNISNNDEVASKPSEKRKELDCNQSDINTEESIDKEEAEKDVQTTDNTPDEETNREMETEGNFEDNSIQSNDAQVTQITENMELADVCRERDEKWNCLSERDNVTDGQDSNILDESKKDCSGSNRVNSAKVEETTGGKEMKRGQSDFAEKEETIEQKEMNRDQLDFAEEEETIGEKAMKFDFCAEENRSSLNGREASDTEMDDRRLMEEIDAQLGECEGEGDSACDRDKITLADLLPDKMHGRSIDLDNMADEFTFDP